MGMFPSAFFLLAKSDSRRLVDGIAEMVRKKQSKKDASSLYCCSEVSVWTGVRT